MILHFEVGFSISLSLRILQFVLKLDFGNVRDPTFRGLDSANLPPKMDSYFAFQGRPSQEIIGSEPLYECSTEIYS
ncbi:hypothetical protein DLM75_12020 [Leptospira stimsonii]|uniref:Uncharacterized protein n=1 Tax=Leptospira stimsonii TaxID=2202203 RepID=A0A396Z7P0_9LEPT|nr:hypothetical protein DLM75_12020 [Leptospira stimsonii]